ncbi:4255_t:CDS:2 [Paraglomus occultum]|uniref:4255_t:CDS:1 n=1 Tax=Paraglomus occultum TaxID=144539 RepID=A0A9N9CYB9_9GLOM|nr:4255_t:CDS:2 [Paraglomus occultum]
MAKTSFQESHAELGHKPMAKTSFQESHAELGHKPMVKTSFQETHAELCDIRMAQTSCEETHAEPSESVTGDERRLIIRAAEARFADDDTTLFRNIDTGPARTYQVYGAGQIGWGIGRVC